MDKWLQRTGTKQFCLKSQAVEATNDNQTKVPTVSTSRQFLKKWTTSYPWVVYDETKQKAFCFMCKSAVNEKITLPLSTSMDINSKKAFVDIGFCNWNKAVDRFISHEGSNFHRASTTFMATKKKGTNICATLSASKAKEMKQARSALLKIISSILYLSKQGLGIRGHDDLNSNIQQLLILRATDVPELNDLLLRTKYKWISHDIQNEILKILAHNIKIKLISEIKSAFFYSIIIDETTDVSNKEQVSFCFRFVDNNLNITEHFLGFSESPFTDALTLFNLVKNTLLKFDLNIKNCRGQCYDEAANVSGHVTGLQKRIQELEPRAIFVHCTAHTLTLTYLVVQDAMQHIDKVRDFLMSLRNLISFVRNSPKRQNIFNSLQAVNDQNLPVNSFLRPFCPTRWCVRIVSLKTVITNYNSLILFLRQYATERNEAGAISNGFLKQIQKFEYFFLVNMMIFVFEKIEILNVELQRKSLHFQDARLKINAIIIALEEKRKSGFDSLWEYLCKKSKELGLFEAKVSRQKKIAKHLAGSGEQHYIETPKDEFRVIFYEVLDVTLNALKNRFQRKVIEQLSTFESYLTGKNDIQTATITEFYDSDFDENKLELHRNLLLDVAKSKNINLSSISDIVKILEKETYLKDLVTEAVKLVNILLTVPVTSCTAERSFSSLRRLKTFLRSTMTQTRLNDLAIIQTHKDETIDIDEIANQYINVASVRKNTFIIN